MNRLVKTVGDCEVNPAHVNVELTLQHGNIMMCAECAAKEAAATTAKVIEFARKQDSSLELKQDLFNAATVSFIELQAAIENNPEIPTQQKNFRLMEEVAARIEKLNSVIFADEAALTAKKNERHALLVNAQNVAAKLHEREREKFKQYDVNYRPQAPKTVKPKAVTKAKRPFSITTLKEAAAKYHVPLNRIQMMAEARNISAEQAAKELATALGLL